MRIKLRLLASLAQITSKDFIEVKLPRGARAADLRNVMKTVLGIDERIANESALLRGGIALRDNDELNEGDEITVLPPVSGGCSYSLNNEEDR